MENFTLNTTHATGPFTWTSAAPHAFDTAYTQPFDSAALGMCSPVQDRYVNYINALVAVNSVRPDHGAAKQAAPPRGNPR